MFSSYLEKVRTFQQNQKQLNRPVRIIVTSRITLIDKARIPVNSTILRLMEFDQQQRQAWINIWNSTNSEYFTNNGILPFKLPEKGKKNNIIELAEQPLLLLMLALYDSESNELAKNVNIKRTELYDNLIRRFIRRERSRYIPDFDEKTQAEQDLIIDTNKFSFNARFLCNYLSKEVRKLNIAGDGTYNMISVVLSTNHSDCRLRYGTDYPDVLSVSLHISDDEQREYNAMTDLNDRYEFYLQQLEKGYLYASKFKKVPIAELMKLHEQFRINDYKNEWLWKKRLIRDYGLYIFFKCY